MDTEIINKIELLDSGELLLSIEGNGNSMYQYIYREAAGVYWDQENHGFKSTELKDWSCARWFFHIVDAVKSGLGVELKLSNASVWQNIPEQDKTEIINDKNI